MNGRLIPQSQLDPALQQQMFELLHTHFAGVDWCQFTADLSQKNWVILIEDCNGRLVGFSTLLLLYDQEAGQPVTVVYSGDTIMDPSAWRSAALSRTWITSVMWLNSQYGRGRLYWLLITSGYRTYRFLPLFWKRFHPRHDQGAVAGLAPLADRLASRLFPTRYDPASRIVRFERPQILRKHLQGIPDSKKDDPHVAFFAKANPGFIQGDELVCLTELSEDNLTPAGWRMVHAGSDRLYVQAST